MPEVPPGPWDQIDQDRQPDRPPDRDRPRAPQLSDVSGAGWGAVPVDAARVLPVRRSVRRAGAQAPAQGAVDAGGVRAMTYRRLYIIGVSWVTVVVVLCALAAHTLGGRA